MPTPASGTISMDDMRTHINRATTSAISMSEMRDRYGGSGAISFSDLYDCEGFVASPASYASKFINFEGWEYRVWGVGSVSPNEASGVQVAANSYIGGMTSPTGTSTDSIIYLYSDTSIGSANGSFTSGYTSADITRVVTANTSRTLASTSGDSQRFFTYDWPSSGTIHCLVKF
jgi:hypothetical protein